MPNRLPPPGQKATAAVAVALILTAHAAAQAEATSPTRLLESAAAKARPTTPSAAGDADLSMFFPPRQRDCNAAASYTRAFEIFRADRDRVRYGEQWNLLLDRPFMRAALDLVTSAARCASCDFIPFLPDDLDRASKFPYLVETQVLAKLLAVRTRGLLAAGRRDEALATARTLMAFGRHLRMSALVLSAEIQGLAIERLAIACFREILSDADPVTSAKLRAIEALLDGTQQYIADQVSSHSAAGVPAFSADLAWLRSPHPVLRCEAILNIAYQALPRRVLVKPTPTIDLGTLLRRLEATTSPQMLRLRREEFLTRIDWPRRGVRPGLTLEDYKRLRDAVEPLARSDPDHRVRALTNRLLEALVEPKPTPEVPKLPASRLPPRPRPPSRPAPPSPPR